ncbi:hypothetical protein MMC31_005500 [Peltigera leucophlebia]|nr:hypothetical protein [Peltigera leucophlebia]
MHPARPNCSYIEFNGGYVALTHRRRPKLSTELSTANPKSTPIPTKMRAISFEKIVESPVFCFLVGKNRKPMSIHMAAVAVQSPALQTLLGGEMIEARTRTVIWDDVDEETFALFAEFVYTGDYSLSASSNQNLDPPTVPSADDDNKVETPEACRTPQPKVTTRNLTSTRAVPLKAPSGNCNLFLLVHARLYVLADKYNITNLMALANQKLYNKLADCIPVDVADYDQVMELVRYVYDNTPSSTSSRNLLRQTVVELIADELSDVLIGSKECLSVVEECGAFARDLISSLLEKRASFNI